MALLESPEVVGLNVNDGSFIDFTRRDQIASDQVAEPLGGKRLNLVIVGGHRSPYPPLFVRQRRNEQQRQDCDGAAHAAATA